MAVNNCTKMFICVRRAVDNSLLLNLLLSWRSRCLRHRDIFHSLTVNKTTTTFELIGPSPSQFVTFVLLTSIITSRGSEIHKDCCWDVFRGVLCVLGKRNNAFLLDRIKVSYLRPVSNVVLLPCRSQLIKLNFDFSTAVARRVKPSRATAV